MIAKVWKPAPCWAALCLAVSAAGAAAQEMDPANPPPAPPPPPPMTMAAPPPPPPMPYAICIDYCTRDDESLSFRQCHELCRELVPSPSAAGGR